MNAHDASHLTMRQDFFADPAASAAHGALLLDVFAIDARARDAMAGVDLAWMPFAAFTDDGACVASVEAAVLRLCCDGAPAAATGLRSVAVRPAWRGRGLFRALTLQALAWCETTPGPTLLYTGEPALYARFGFASLAQHAFVGAMPAVAVATTPARPLDRDGDLALVNRLLATRAPVSERCAMVGATSLFLTALGGEDLAVAHLPAQDALVVYEEDEEALTLVDVVAATIPPLPAILGALPRRRWLKTLFPPDRLGWDGAPVPDDTGLMRRGPLPPAMRRPFMLPPTAGF